MGALAFIVGFGVTVLVGRLTDWPVWVAVLVGFGAAWLISYLIIELEYR